MKKLWQPLGIAAFWLTWPGIWLYLHNTRRTRVIITAGDKVLLMKGWLSAGQWILPGGGAHRSEDARQAALREVKEETGIQLAAEQLRDLGEIQGKEYGFRFACHVFTVDLPTALPLKARRLEVTDVQWIDKSTGNLSPLTQELLATPKP